MDERLLEIRDHQGEGYKPLVDFGSWRVAILRPEPERRPPSMERHLETDEVFVLTLGEATIIVGGNGQEPGGLAAQAMEIGKVYNVRKRVWHTVRLSEEAAVVIMENRDTVRENSEYAGVSEDQLRSTLEELQSTPRD